MYILTVVLHVFVCFILIGVVLLQSGKGAETGAAFGGSSQTLFGSGGATTFLTKLTLGTAVLYMVTSLALTALKKDQSMFSSFPSQATSTPVGTSTATSTSTSTSTMEQTDAASSDPLAIPTPTATDQTGSSGG
jgi:preprotein translocase subunit SecG